MRLSVRFHPGPPSAGQTPPGTPAPTPPYSGRLNLLLSYAGWQPDPWVERLPPLLEPMGVQSLRAASGREAQDVIRTNPIHIAVVDLGLPLDSVDSEADAPELSEGGSRLLELLHRLDQPPPTVVVKRARSTRDDHRDMAAALRLGAFAVVDRPRDQHDLNLILEVLRRCLTRFYQGRWPGGVGGRDEGSGLRT
ncbi:MAG: response regulator [Phycisphaerales bacterium]|nr:response regulator [Phycisphaerales bacterium]